MFVRHTQAEYETVFSKTLLLIDFRKIIINDNYGEFCATNVRKFYIYRHSRSLQNEMSWKIKQFSSTAKVAKV